MRDENRLKLYPKILEFMKANGRANRSEISKALGMERTDVDDVVRGLILNGFLKPMKNDLQLKRGIEG
jgi:predicted transcriptional regulator